MLKGQLLIPVLSGELPYVARDLSRSIKQSCFGAMPLIRARGRVGVTACCWLRGKHQRDLSATRRYLLLAERAADETYQAAMRKCREIADMDCTQIRQRVLGGGDTASPEAKRHLDECPACKDLVADNGSLARFLADADRRGLAHPRRHRTGQRNACTGTDGAASSACSHLGADGRCRVKSTAAGASQTVTAWLYTGNADTGKMACTSNGQTWIAP